MQRLLSSLCILLFCCWLVSADLTLEILDSDFANQAGARCLDGSPGSFHFEQGAETKKWVLFMEGGGSCDNENECAARALTDLGSSTEQPATLQSYSVVSNSPAVNPGFWNWTHVRLDYCSGDRWAGTRVNASTETWGLYFAGHAIFKTILEHLITKYQLDQATEILFHGGSAGALGVMSNVDYLNQRLPTPTISLGMDSGRGVDFFPAWDGLGIGGVIDTVFNLYQGHVNTECAAANPNNLTMCIFPRYVFAYIPNRIFVLNSLIDLVQLAILGFPNSDIFATGGDTYLISLGEYTKLSIIEEFKRNPRANGLFITTCPDHMINVEIQGTLPNVAFANWYYRPKTSSTPAINYDNCAIDSVVSLLKSNSSLLTDCPALMRLCTKNKNNNNGSVSAFEEIFNSALLPSDEPSAAPDAPFTSEAPTSSPQSVPKGAAKSVGVIHSMSIVAVMMGALVWL